MRESSHHELERAGKQAAPFVAKALTRTPSGETRQRLKSLARFFDLPFDAPPANDKPGERPDANLHEAPDAVNADPPVGAAADVRRTIRAVQAMEWLNTQATREQLIRWSQSADHDVATRAKTTLHRLLPDDRRFVPASFARYVHPTTRTADIAATQPAVLSLHRAAIAVHLADSIPDTTPLPKFAVARLGSTKFLTDGSPPGSYRLSPDGKLLIGVTAPGLVPVFDAGTGALQFQISAAELKAARLVDIGFSSDTIYALWESGELSAYSTADGHRVRSAQVPLPDNSFVRFGTFASNGRLIAYIGDDTRTHRPRVDSFTLFDTQTMSASATSIDLPDGVTSLWRLCLSGDGATLGALDDRRCVHLWNTQTGKAIAIPPIRLTPDQADAGISLSTDGGALILHSRPPEVWDLHKLKPTVDPAWRAVLDASLYPTLSEPAGGRIAALAGGKLSVFDTNAPASAKSIDTGLDPATGVTLSAGGSRAAVWINGNRPRVFDLATGRRVFDLGGHEKPIGAITASSDGAHIFTGDVDGTLIRWDARSGRAEATGRLAGADVDLWPGIRLLSLDPQQRLCALTDLTHSALIDPDQLTTLGAQALPIRFARNGAWSSDGRLLARAVGLEVMTRPGVMVWARLTGKCVRFIGSDGAQPPEMAARKVGSETEASPTVCMAFSPDGKMFAVGSSLEMPFMRPIDTRNITRQHLAVAPLQCWDTRTWNPIPLAKLGDDVKSVEQVAFAPNAIDLAIVHQGLVSLCGKDGEVRWRQSAGQYSGGAVCFSPDGRMLVIGSTDGLRIFDVLSGGLIAELESEASAVQSACFFPDGLRFATATRSPVAYVWDLRAVFAAGNPTTRPTAKLSWEQLGSSDASTAYAAMSALIEQPDETKLLCEVNQGKYPAIRKTFERLAQANDPNRDELQRKLEVQLLPAERTMLLRMLNEGIGGELHDRLMAIARSQNITPKPTTAPTGPSGTQWGPELSEDELRCERCEQLMRWLGDTPSQKR